MCQIHKLGVFDALKLTWMLICYPHFVCKLFVNYCYYYCVFDTLKLIWMLNGDNKLTFKSVLMCQIHKLGVFDTLKLIWMLICYPHFVYEIMLLIRLTLLKHKINKNTSSFCVQVIWNDDAWLDLEPSGSGWQLIEAERFPLPTKYCRYEAWEEHFYCLLLWTINKFYTGTYIMVPCSCWALWYWVSSRSGSDFAFWDAWNITSTVKTSLKNL